ncbi:hypothetical protein D3C72_1696040 [compost metagenome]
MPNHRITSGISASGGMLRTICSVLSSSVAALRKVPVSSPSSRPRPPPMANPASARQVLTPTCFHNSPERARSQAACNTASGAGSTRFDSQPFCEAACHTTISSTGTIHGATTRASAAGCRRGGGRCGALMPPSFSSARRAARCRSP